MCEDAQCKKRSEKEQARKEVSGEPVIEQSIALVCGAEWETNRKQGTEGRRTGGGRLIGASGE